MSKPSDRKPADHVVDALKKLLARAQNGEITWMGVVLHTREDVEIGVVGDTPAMEDMFRTIDTFSHAMHEIVVDESESNTLMVIEDTDN